MTIAVSCPECGHAYRVKEEHAGKTMRCKACDAKFVVQADDDFSTDDDDLALLERESPSISQRPMKSSKKSAAPKKSKKKSSSNSAMKWALGIGGGLVVMLGLCCGGVMFVGRQAMHQLVGQVPVPAGQTYEQWRSGFQTKLLTRGPSPQEGEFETPPEHVTEIMYPSDGLQLKAWVYRPPGGAEKKPALVFFHGGFAFGAGDLTETCVPFMEAGYIVMTPMLRGENGNPGDFELFLGEINDARAAVHWLAQQPDVDASRIYTFGHSVGGGVSALLSLRDNVPIRHGGSSGGLYDATTFIGWGDIVPFENTPAERSVRILHGNVPHMQVPHYAYIGTEDEPFPESARAMQQEANPQGHFHVELIPGDHFSSFDEAVRRYFAICQQDQAGAQ